MKPNRQSNQFGRVLTYDEFVANWQNRTSKEIPMCRNIKTLFNFEPPAAKAEARGVGHG